MQHAPGALHVDRMLNVRRNSRSVARRDPLHNRDYICDCGTARGLGELQNFRGNRDCRGEDRDCWNKYEKYESRAGPVFLFAAQGPGARAHEPTSTRRIP